MDPSSTKGAAAEATLFRDGRWIIAGSIVGSILIAAACFGGLITSVEMTEGNWRSWTWFRLIFVFISIFGGLSSIIVSLLKFSRQLIVLSFISALIALSFAVYPCGFQLLAGPVEHVGEIEKIEVFEESSRFYIKPETNVVSKARTQRPTAIHLVLRSGDRKIVHVLHRDLVRLFPKPAQPTSKSSQPITYQLVTLPYLNRLLKLKPISLGK